MPTRFAFAEQNIISIPCPPAAIEIPEGGLRAASDGDAWGFSIVPQTGVLVSNQQWLFNGLSPNAPQLNSAWGTFGGGDNTNAFTWLSPTQGGSYSITVKAKRRCVGEGGPGGEEGAPIDEDFEIAWNVDVEQQRTWTTPSPLAANWVSPAEGQPVAPLTPLACSVLASDSDHWIAGAESGDDADLLTYLWSSSGGGSFRGSGASVSFVPPDAAGSYVLTCVIDDEPKELGTLDNGTRDDAPVTLTRTVVVPPRAWTSTPAIGDVLDDKGNAAKDKDDNPIYNGRMIAPQNQVKTPPNPANPIIVRVRPGEELSCLVEEASDWDKWTRPGLTEEPAGYKLTHGHEEDELKYQWQAGAGSWKNGKTDARGATWIAPALVAGANIYTLSCALDDLPKPIVAPETGARDDAIVTRSVQVQVVDETSWMSLKLHRQGTPTQPGDEIDGPSGGDLVIAVEIQVGGKSKLVVPPEGTGGSGMLLRIEEHDGLGLHDESDNHAFVAVPLGTPNAWQKWENEAWQATTETPSSENDDPAPKRFRALLDWKTTAEKISADPDGADATTGGPLKAGKLWGHNSSHSIGVEYSTKDGDEWKIKAAAEFQTKDVGGNYEAARKAGPNVLGADVSNSPYAAA